MLRAVLLAILCASVVSVPPLAAQDPEPPRTTRLQLSDLSRIVYPNAPDISPSGATVALVAYRAALEENRWDGSLVSVDVASGEQKELVPELEGVDGPRWSPSGDRLAFLASDADGVTQLWVVDPEGRAPAQVTTGGRGVHFYRWSPDGRHFVFGRADDPPRRTGLDRHNRSFQVGPDSYLADSAPTPVHLWRIPAHGGPADRLTAGERTVNDFDWDPEGDALLVETAPSAHGALWLRTALHRLDLATGEMVPWIEAGVPFAPRSSRDADLVAYLARRGSGQEGTPNGAFVVPPAGGEPRDATAGLDRDLGDVVWLPDGSGLLVSGPDGTTVGAWLQPLGGRARRLDLGSVAPLSPFSMSEDGRVAFVGTEPYRPLEVYVMEGPAWAPRRLTGFNDEIASRTLGRVETLAWEGPDGLTMDGVLIHPPGFRQGERYPLLVHIHGGPYYTDIEGFSPTYIPFRGMDQLFAAQGWLVFKPNFRGSNNRGAAFQRAIVHDVAEGPARDVLSGIELLKERGIVDEGRIALAGWSYGGFLAAWLTAHHDGWAAAVVGAADTDWVDAYSASDMAAGNATAGWLGGSPWRGGNLENYRRQSVVTHAARIRTPTLILSNTGDARVPVIGSYKLFHALRDNGVEVRFVAYPLGGHFPGDPVHRMDLIRRWIDWIAEHFREGEEPAPGP